MSFESLGLHEALTRSVADSGYDTATEVQTQAIPPAIAGHDLMVSASTGSGKTASFILPALQRILAARGDNTKRREKGVVYGPRILVLTPTRELAIQVAKAADTYGRHVQGLRVATVVGGVPYPMQIKALRGPLDILIATPGRLLDHLQTGKAVLDNVEVLVLDEADRMLDMGFEPQIRKIIGQIRPDRQTCMWSATWPKEVRQLAADYQSNWIQVTVGSMELSANHRITQQVEVVSEFEKRDKMLRHIEKIMEDKASKVLVFTGTKRVADDITRFLRQDGWPALSIHGDKQQNERDWVLNEFKMGKSPIMVATDVASRGIGMIANPPLSPPPPLPPPFPSVLSA
jgi:ATP-dependent RNA helicase DDX5/DBP2